MTDVVKPANGGEVQVNRRAPSPQSAALRPSGSSRSWASNWCWSPFPTLRGAWPRTWTSPRLRACRCSSRTCALGRPATRWCGATCADDTSATAITSCSESTEYGTPRAAALAFSSFGWLGSNQRSTQSLAGLPDGSPTLGPGDWPLPVERFCLGRECKYLHIFRRSGDRSGFDRPVFLAAIFSAGLVISYGTVWHAVTKYFRHWRRSQKIMHQEFGFTKHQAQECLGWAFLAGLRVAYSTLQ